MKYIAFFFFVWKELLKESAQYNQLLAMNEWVNPTLCNWTSAYWARVSDPLSICREALAAILRQENDCVYFADRNILLNIIPYFLLIEPCIIYLTLTLINEVN